jgi:ABC-type branched-subunit amino acid transport system substrate-binding protein
VRTEPVRVSSQARHSCREKGTHGRSTPSSTSVNDAVAFAEYLKARGDVRTVALLNQNDDFGKGYATALKKALAGSNITIVEEETYLQTDRGRPHADH